MPIEQVQAYKISDGRAFAQKEDAYREERNALCAALRKVAERSQSSFQNLKDFRKLVVEARGWLTAAEESLAQMTGEKDADVADKVRKQE